MALFKKDTEKQIKQLQSQIRIKDARIRQLEDLCEEKDSFFLEMISDGMRKGSSLAAKHMSDRKSYLKGK